MRTEFSMDSSSTVLFKLCTSSKCGTRVETKIKYFVFIAVQSPTKSYIWLSFVHKFTVIVSLSRSKEMEVGSNKKSMQK